MFNSGIIDAVSELLEDHSKIAEFGPKIGPLKQSPSGDRRKDRPCQEEAEMTIGGQRIGQQNVLSGFHTYHCSNYRKDPLVDRSPNNVSPAPGSERGLKGKERGES